MASVTGFHGQSTPESRRGSGNEKGFYDLTKIAF